MKKSIFWRGILILAVLVGWAYALYPLNDQPFLKTFNQLAEARVSPAVEEAIEEAERRLQAAAKDGRELTFKEALLQVVDGQEHGMALAKVIRLPDTPAPAEKPAAGDEDAPQEPEMKPDDAAAESGLPANQEVLDYVEKQAGGKDFEATLRSVIRDTAKKQLQELVAGTKTRVEESEEAARKAEAAGNTDVRPLPAEMAMIEVAEEMNVELYNFVDIYNRQRPINKEVAFYVRNYGRGKLKFGLDLRGGTEFRVTFNEEDLPRGSSATQVRDEIIEVLRKRVDPFGVSEVEIRPDASNSITVRTPSVDPAEIARIREMLNKQAKLEFRMVVPGTAQEHEMLLASGENPGPEYELVEHVINDDRGNEIRKKIWVLKQPEPITGGDIVSARAERDEHGLPQVGVTLNQSGGIAMNKTTAAAIARREQTGKVQRMAMMLDGVVFSAPAIQGQFGSNFRITGNFSPEEASKLALLLRSGNLPVKIEIDSEMSTAATLGAKLVDSGKLAIIIGMALVVVFMLGYYRGAGVIAVAALAANVLLIFGTLPIVRAALTLPGIAGIVLTIGMAVDANVLIFERIREELNNGKSLATAIKNGYGRAFVTILDANLTTLFTAYFLYLFGTGPIRGFAVTLSIGICASMFTALFMTRWCFDLLVEFNLLKNPKLMHSRLKPAETGKAAEAGKEIPFLNFRKATAVLSVVLMAGAIAVVGVRNKSSMSVDFTGGALITMEYGAAERVAVTDVENALAEAQLPNAKVTYKSSMVSESTLLEVVLPNDVVEERLASAETRGIHDIVLEELNQAFPSASLSNGSSSKVGGLVGNEFQKKALYAIISALVVIVLYISFRFQFSYSVGAVAALIHDVIICTGIFLIWGLGDRQISLTVIAALLTIIGYSLNDTIVVFDRIRENLEFHKKKKFLDIVNLSINQTLSRTLLTSLTTFLVVLSLYIVGGGGAINDFAVVMMAGIVVGTYSSIFVATPVMVLWQSRKTAATAESTGSKNKQRKKAEQSV